LPELLYFLSGASWVAKIENLAFTDIASFGADRRCLMQEMVNIVLQILQTVGKATK